MARLTLLVGILLVTLGSDFRCSTSSGFDDDDGDNNGSGPTFTTTLVLRDATGIETRDFDRGETIVFELSVRNRTGDTVNVQFDDAQQSDFVVVDDGSPTLRWRWSDGRAFAQVVTELSFAPRETRTIRVEWTQQLADGSTLPSGNYEARGVLLFPEFQTDIFATHEMGSALREFTVN